ncbi:MAG: helix-turn-helix domain-containing protein [Haloarculaceae archaeon]
MGLIAEFRLRSERLPLVDVAAAVPAATLEFETIQPRPDGPPTFVVRASGADADAVEAAFADADSVTGHSLVVGDGETHLHQCRPVGGPPEGLETLADSGSVPDRVTVTPTGWDERRWFADRDEFDAFRSFCRANDYAFDLDSLVSVGGETGADAIGSTDGRSRPDGMTDAQYEALVTADEMGYFDVPRTATLADVGDELDVAPPSLSERLRRAQSHLVAAFRRADDRMKPRIN